MNYINQLSADVLKTFETLPDPYLIISPKFSVLTASDAYLLATGTTRKQISGKYIPEIYSAHTSLLQACLQKVLETGKPQEYTLPGYNAHGKSSTDAAAGQKHWHTLNTPVLDERGQVLYIIHKICETKEEANHGQRQSGSVRFTSADNGEPISRQAQAVPEKYYRTLFESMDQGFCIIEMIFDKDRNPVDYRFIEYNAVFEDQTGLKEAAGKTALELIPNLEAHWFELYGHVALTGKPSRFTQGSQAMGRWFEVYAYRVGGENSHNVAILFSDISARRQAEIKLKESEQRFGSIFNQTSVGIAQTDLDGKFMLVNSRYCEIVGWPEEKLYQMHLFDITHPEDIAANTFLLQKSLDENIPFSIEKRYIRGDGSFIWVNVNVSAVKDAAGRPLYIVGVCLDITAHKQALEALKESEKRLSRVIEASSDGIWDWDFVNDRAWWNSRYSEILGVDISHHKRGLKVLNEYIHPDDRHLIPEALKAHLNSGKKYEVDFRLVRPSGEIRHVSVKGKAITDGNGSITKLSGTLTDITERKKAEEALRESEHLFRTFANNIQNLAWIAAPDGWIYWYNQLWYDYTGTTYEQMQGWGWEKVHHPDHVDRVVAFVKEAWAKGESFELTFPLKGVNGSYRWFLTRVFPVKDAQGQVVRWIGTNTDIDDQKMAESSLAEKNRQLTVINNDLDNFIYTASHDLRAPISNIEGLMQAIFRHLSPDSKQNPAIIKFSGLITNSIERFKRTLNDLTQITKIGREGNEEDVTEVDLLTVIGEVRLDLSSQIEQADARIEVDMRDCTPVPFSAKNARSIVYNLLSNAIKYRSPSRQVFIRISCLLEDDYMVLLVEDNGLGIDLSQEDKIFAMFKRLHDHVEGSGVGLYIVKKIIENAGGKIEVQSEVDRGTIFKVYFRKQ